MNESKVATPGPVEGMSRAELRDLALYKVLCALPVAVVSRIGAALSLKLGRRANPAADARVASAIRQLRPDLAGSPAELEATQIRFWKHVGRIYAEYCVLHKIVPGGRVGIDDRPTYDAVLNSDRPVIATFVHLGNWESCGSQLSLRAPGRVCALANPMPPNRIQAQIATMQHGRMPAKVVTFDGNAWRHALAHLQQPGSILFIAADERPQGRVSLPSFGRPLDPSANAHKIVRVAARTGAVILPLYSERLPGARFCTHVLPPVEIARQSGSDPQHLQRYVTQLDALYHAPVLRLLDQWFGLLDYR
jgi:KDO2-lipid IV(A) lauroyltransferase